jgi:hypothetical protein
MHTCQMVTNELLIFTDFKICAEQSRRKQAHATSIEKYMEKRFI